MSREEMLRSSSSMKKIRQLDQTTGRTMLWKSKAMVVQATSDSLQVSTQDGGKCSTKMEHLLSMKKEKSWTFLEGLIEKTRTSRCSTSMEKSTNYSISSMRTSGRRSQSKENSTKSLVSMLKYHSTLFLRCHQTDIST
jgi:hypothetical protein